jgi:hypothetical protein
VTSTVAIYSIKTPKKDCDGVPLNQKKKIPLLQFTSTEIMGIISTLDPYPKWLNVTFK